MSDNIKDLQKYYFKVIGEIEEIGKKFAEKGYSSDQVVDIITVLAQEVPVLVFGEDKLTEIVHSIENDELSFEEMDKAIEKGKNTKYSYDEIKHVTK